MFTPGPFAVHLLASLLLGQPGAAAPTAQPVNPPQPAPLPGPVATAAPALPTDQPVGPYKSAGELLDALQRADQSLTSLSADVQYSKQFADLEGGEKQIRRGKLFFQSRPDPGDAQARPRRAFSVVFDILIVDRTVRNQRREFVFDSVYLVERDTANKQFLKRRVVRPGETTDPLRIGEGPFPLPIGQKKADILARFDAVLLKPETGFGAELPASFANTAQLLLVPKLGTQQARDFDEIRIWYRLDSDLLPRLARTRTPAGAGSEVLLLNHALNTPIDQAVFSVDPPKEPGWQVDIREDFRGLNERNAAPAPTQPETRPSPPPTEPG
jgi:hypothetical protein